MSDRLTNLQSSQKIMFASGLLLVGVGGFWCFFALIARIDGEEEFHWILKQDLVAGLPVAVGASLMVASFPRPLRPTPV